MPARRPGGAASIDRGRSSHRYCNHHRLDRYACRDSEEAASLSAQIFHDKRVQQFHESNRYLGKIIAESLGNRDAIAWDTYLFYAKGSEWKEDMPALLDWAHQLDDPWADPDHFVWGDDLPVRLRDITNGLIQN